MTFSTHEPLMRWRYWLPGLVVASLIMIFGLAFGVFYMNAWGWSIWIATPVAGAVLLGYGVHTGRWVTWALALILGAVFIAAMASMQLGGAFCAMILLTILLLAIFFGVAIGILLRNAMKNTTFGQRWHLPSIAILMLIGCYWLDGPRKPSGIESVVTEQRIEFSADEAFDSLMFYEEVRHPPPWLLRIGLVRPLFTRGSSKSVGDTKICVYNHGTITKRVVGVVPGRRLDFEVVEQSIGYEHDVLLQGGSFEFIPIGPHACTVRLTTNYRPQLSPRLCWRWGERIGVGTLHRHVIEGIDLEGRRNRDAGSDGIPTAPNEEQASPAPPTDPAVPTTPVAVLPPGSSFARGATVW